MAEIEKLAQSESTEGIRLNMCLSAVNHHVWVLHVEPDELPLPLTTTSSSKVEHKLTGSRIRSMNQVSF